MLLRKKTYLTLLCLGFQFLTFSQEPSASFPSLRFNFNEENSQYVKFSVLGQVWLRHTDLNPGSSISSFSMDQYTDLSLRRWRFSIEAQLSDRIFFYSQAGENNFNFHSEKYEGFFIHDAVMEYHLLKNYLSLGGGLTGWSGLARYAAPSVASILTLDAPLYQQATNGINEQFLRKLSVYLKGQLGKIDYRFILTQPMTLNNPQSEPSSTDFTFSSKPPKKQVQGYVKYMFKDSESNKTPYQPGTYLGKKNILNIGGGFIFQPDAMWALNDAGGTREKNMFLSSIDFFIEKPIDSKTAFTFYSALSNYQMGSNYIRYVGVDNPATGSVQNGSNNYGNAFPMIGTGTTAYMQAGLLIRNIQPFAAIQYSEFEKLDDPSIMWETGLNYLLLPGYSKLSIEYQNRPYFIPQNEFLVSAERKGMWVVQYQLSF